MRSATRSPTSARTGQRCRARLPCDRVCALAAVLADAWRAGSGLRVRSGGPRGTVVVARLAARRRQTATVHRYEKPLSRQSSPLDDRWWPTSTDAELLTG